jgi:hypothetical protein
MGRDLGRHRVPLCLAMPLQIWPAGVFDAKEPDQGSRCLHLVRTLTQGNLLLTLRRSAPGGNTKSFDPTDCSLAKAKEAGKYGIMKSAERDGLVVDAFTQVFQERNPSVKFYHLYPGIVSTNGAKNAGFPVPIQWAFKLAAPLIANTPEAYAEIPVMIATSQPAHRFFSRANETQPNKWTLIAENRKAIYDNMLSVLKGDST